MMIVRMIGMMNMIVGKFACQLQGGEGARGASSSDGASRGPFGAKPCKLPGLGPSDGSLHTLLRPLEMARLLQNRLHGIILIILTIILVALKRHK